MKKFVPALIAIILIFIIGGLYFGKIFLDRYSYSKEYVNLDEYYGVNSDELAIILQNDVLEAKAYMKDGVCFIDLDTVHDILSEVFYVDYNAQLVLFTTATDTIKTSFDANVYTDEAGEHGLNYTTCFVEDSMVYLALDYVKLFNNFEYEITERKLQIYNTWDARELYTVNKNTAIRERGGVKSDILRDISQGEKVEVLEQMDNWSKVKTSDSFMGYIENKRLSNKSETIQPNPVTDYIAPEYTSVLMDKKVSLGWHAIGGVAGNDTLNSVVSETIGMNVIAPTWFSLNDNQGNFRDFSSSSYVSKAHDMGLKVWGVFDDFNYKNETGAQISVLEILSNTTTRNTLVKNMINKAATLSLDGINIDFETVGNESGIHFVQFIRELSVECRKLGVVLSIDNYVPLNFNNYYRLDIQGQVADYCIIMGYDEHWHGSGEPGSVASIGYVSGGLERTLKAVDAKKVINALPLYTILWKTNGATVTDEYITYNNVADFLSRANVSYTWDEVTSQNYAEWDSGDTHYQIWIEDEESIAVKLNVMNSNNIGGVAVWRLGYGNNEVWKLINAYTNS